MKTKALITILIFVCGCTSVKPVELAPEQLQEKISTDHVIHIGDKVQVITEDGARHSFKVTAIENGSVLGKDVNIPIEKIVALETTRFSGGKTSALIGGSLLWLYILLLAIPAIVAI